MLTFIFLHRKSTCLCCLHLPIALTNLLSRKVLLSCGAKIYQASWKVVFVRGLLPNASSKIKRCPTLLSCSQRLCPTYACFVCRIANCKWQFLSASSCLWSRDLDGCHKLSFKLWKWIRSDVFQGRSLVVARRVWEEALRKLSVSLASPLCLLVGPR